MTNNYRNSVSLSATRLAVIVQGNAGRARQSRVQRGRDPTLSQNQQAANAHSGSTEPQTVQRQNSAADAGEAGGNTNVVPSLAVEGGLSAASGAVLQSCRVLLRSNRGFSESGAAATALGASLLTGRVACLGVSWSRMTAACLGHA
jgi:hypothetical protein